MDVFIYGTLCHLPLLQVVLGHAVQAKPAQLAGHRAFWAKERPFPILMPDDAAMTSGMLLRGMTAGDIARLNFYEAAFACDACDVMVAADGPVRARVYLPRAGHWHAGPPWDLALWRDQWGAIVTSAARDVMALFGQVDPQAVLARYPMMLVRAASRQRAAAGGPTTLRHAMHPGDVAVSARATPYARFFAVEEYDLQFRRFDGTLSPQVNRAVFIGGDAVTVLPYDPVRDVVLLIEQFRPGPFVRGDAQPWSLEAIAGRIDPGETPEGAARREALEEAGLTLGSLEYVCTYYPSPAAKSECLYSYIALTDLPEGIAGVFGLAGEAEDIRGHRLSFGRFEALLASGEINNAPLILTGLWLQRERARLRATITP